ncbi:SpoIIE family protein phosphatase, partial [Rhodobacterales bacterium HKCCE4037]|nr:SpoIIE family protein phosphatase [Rhodobacterales bacterium HKCCE4037]
MSPAQSAGGSANKTAIGYDVATALWQGKRPYQEDTLLADFHGGMERGFAVLADGMGGHAAGDLASRLVVIDAVSHLKFLMHDGASLESNLNKELTSAIETANGVLKDRASEDSRLQGMGATFLATVMFEDRLYWASVGDSPLYLWREGQLRQLNEDHSMAPIIDQMAKSGELSEEEAANHPDRNALTSVLMGRSIKSMDVPDTATVLDPGDVLIQASDGLQYLDEDKIVKVLEGLGSDATSRQVADALMTALYDLDDPPSRTGHQSTHSIVMKPR